MSNKVLKTILVLGYDDLEKYYRNEFKKDGKEFTTLKNALPFLSSAEQDYLRFKIAQHSGSTIGELNSLFRKVLSDCEKVS